MNTDGKPATSLFAKLLGERQNPWIKVSIGLLLLLLPLGAAYLDGVLAELFSQGYWRGVVFPPTVIIYILVISPIMARMEAGVVEALRPLVLVDEETFNRLVDEASRLPPLGEVMSFGLGAALGLWLSQAWFSDAPVFWLALCVSLSAGLMFGLIGWAIYAALMGTRLTAELHRQPLRIDIFNTKPLEPIGRQSLVSALVFVGGIVLAVVFVGLEGLFAWQNWLVFGLLALVPVLVFFLNMRDTHRVLADEKKRELEAVQGKILLACQGLMERIDANEGTGTLAAEINALVVYEERLQATRTWPYDTAQLRTLFVSVIIPGGAALVRFASEVLFN